MAVKLEALSWFAGGIALVLVLQAWPSPWSVPAAAHEVPKVPSEVAGDPSDVAYDETWEAVEFLGTKKADIEGLFPISSSTPEAWKVKPVSIVTSTASGSGVVGWVALNTYPLSFIDRETVEHPIGGAVTGQQACVGVVAVGQAAVGGFTSLGTPVVSKWKVSGHIHSGK